MNTTTICMEEKIARRRWTPQELGLLIEISQQRRVLREEMHCFPGRTYDALTSQCNRMRLPVHREHGYSEAEDAAIREIYASNSSIKSRLSLLPNRSYSSIKVRARQLGVTGTKAAATDGSLSVVRMSVVTPLKKGDSMTTEVIAAKLGYCLDSVRIALRRGRGKEFYIAGWLRVGLHGIAPTWAHGCGPDAARPPRKDTALSRREYKRRRKIASAAFNPWQIGAAPISALSAPPGRIFKQDMTIHSHDDFEVTA
ncbi:hypothetical protein [Burkholderia ubonensis]|uniref:hypothetical protein n=1 Tax=Burkholderia ubonensis TaxID=101571 RepID=UPI00075BFA9B|nr:hypothetical protein [Burkholderia ubonensis]KVO11744.1 hypothetical protein WJ73_19545 [Burkholderia ubonensis]